MFRTVIITATAVASFALCGPTFATARAGSSLRA